MNRRVAVGSMLAVALFTGSLAPPKTLHAQDTHTHELGRVDFPVSCGPGVQSDFDRAVALLHHMMYEDARRAFEGIAERDAECAMARWGIATTLFQPLWPTRPSPADLRRGHELIEVARELGSVTDVERALIGATGAFFEDPESADWRTRIERWAAAMAEAHAAAPDHVETAALYALSRLALAPYTDDRARLQAEAADVLAAIHAEHPRHPGAIHYTIHANDVDGRAGESLEVVRSYSGIAPSVPHALHMPTHIFVRLGEWDDVIEWNRRSADAALEVDAGGRTSHHYPHATDYLLYAHLQRGDDASARAVMEETLEHGPYQRSFVSAYHLAAMPARFAIEREAWEEAADIEPRTPRELPWDSTYWPEAMSWFARGIGAVHTGDLEAARASEDRMAELRDAAREAGEAGFADYIEVDRLILESLIRRAEGDDEIALEMIRAAVEAEERIEKHPISPGALTPAAEARGHLLMSLDRPAEALAAYETALETWPGRYHSLLGAARAARAAGEDALARAYYRELLETVGNAGSDRAGVTEAKRRLADQAGRPENAPLPQPEEPS